MAQISTTYTPIKINRDASYATIKKGDARFIKDCSLDISVNDGTNGNFGARKPNIGNILAGGIGTETPHLFKMPIGINRTIGAFEFVELSEFYWFAWNENGKHTINYMDRNASNPIRVYEGSCLGFSNDLEYSIPEHNVHIRIVWDVDDSGVKTIKEKLLIFTDGLGEVRQINVLASIATNSFSSDYFKTNECCAYTALAVQPPSKCIGFILKKDNSVPTNKMYKKNLQIACRNVYVDNRISSVSPYSKVIRVGFSGCNIDELSYSNYAELTIPITNDLVDYIELFVRSCNGDWVYYDTIYKHDIKANEVNDWWNRTDGWVKNSYDQVSNTIKYNFYNDKKCGIIDQSIFSNIQNDIPQASKALAVAGDRLLLANNLREYPNLTQEQKDGFTFEVEKQDVEKPCDLPLRKIKVFMKIQGDGVTSHNPTEWNSFLFKDNNEPISGGKYYFGGVCMNSNLLGIYHKEVADDDWKKYNQYVPSETGGFVATLNGKYTSVSKQVKMYSCGNYEEMGVYACNISEVNDKNGSLDELVKQLYDGKFTILQMFEFEVPSGIYSFKVHSHRNGLDGQYQKTSTYIYGNGSYLCSTNTGQATKLDYEWVVDVRNADYDSMANGGDYIILRDCTLPQGDWEINHINRVTECYIYEDDLKTIPIEGIRIRPNLNSSNSTNYPALITDHNGFSFYRVCKPKVGLIFAFLAPIPYIIASATHTINNFPTKFYYDIYNSCSLDLRQYDYSTTIGNKGLDHSASISALINKNVCSHIEVVGYIKDINNIGVGGVFVWTEYNNGDYTDNDGKYTLRIHDGSFPNTRNIYIGTGNGECSVAGLGCTMIAPISYNNSIACTNCTKREIDITDLYVTQNNREKQDTIVGRFMIGAFAHDCFGRLQFVNKLKEIELTNYDEVNKIKWTYNGVALPSKYRKLSFCITDNLNGSIIEWSADLVKFLDINGAVTNNTQDASYISFDISSLINYNKAHDFGTNLLYQYVEGDMLTILSDGKKDLVIPITVKITGATIENANQSNVNVFIDNGGSSSGSQQTEGETLTGNKIIIPFDSKYTFLENSCSVKIRITRPYKCGKEINNYYELCNIYDINNGILSANSGYLDFANNYKITRTISIKDCISSGNSKIYNSNFKNDFINPSCIIRGRVNIENPYAETKWIENEIAESDSWVNGGTVNGLSSFRTENRHNTKSQQYGGIVALQAQRNILLAICRNDWFTCNYDMRYVRVTENGNVEAPLDSRISEPNQKIGSMYGCEFKHKSTIIFYDDFAMWFDSKNHKFVGCSYKDISDVSMDGVSSYFIDKTNYLSNNSSVEVLAGICPKTNKIDITFRDTTLGKYTNNNMDVIVDDNETISYSTKHKMWSEFKGYTTEYYGKLRDSKLGELQITFKHGYPYLHNTNLANICEYFGEKVRPTFSFVVNEEPTAEKNFQAVAQNIKGQNLILEQVHTEAWNSYSYIPQAYWVKKQDIVYAELLRDMTGYFDPNKPQIISQLIDGKRIVGKWAFFRFTLPMDKQGEYWELDSILIQMAKSELTSKNTSQ